jgi:hypothetical protein
MPMPLETVGDNTLRMLHFRSQVIVVKQIVGSKLPGQ